MADAAAARIVVTGINGFVGRHLAAELAGNGIAVMGIGTEDRPDPALEGLLADYLVADLVEEWPRTGPVEAIIHLAGLAAVGPSFDDPQRYITVNSSIVTNLCEAVLASGWRPRIILVSSGAIYDDKQRLPLTEQSSVALNSPYAVSKVLNENQAAYYRGRGLDCVIARPFNHIGPGQGPGFLLPDLAAAVEERGTSVSKAPNLDFEAPLRSAPQSANPPLKTGDLATKRDYTDVRDVARAYRLLATQPALSHEVYNICSGHSLAGNYILAGLLTASGLSSIDTEIDEARLRPNDPADIVGDNSRLRDDLGWVPRFSIEDTIADYLRER